MTDGIRRWDVIIVGGGLSGLTLGISLSVCGIKTAVVDASDPDRAKHAQFDGRVTALSPASVNLLRAIDVWESVSEEAQLIKDILVTDGRAPNRFERGGAAPLFLHFDTAISENDEAAARGLGEIVENRVLLSCLQRRAESSALLEVFAPERVVDLSTNGSTVSATLASGSRLDASLCLACDGRNSPTRRKLGLRTLEWSYPQAGLVTTVAHEDPHDGIAQEYFLPSGPFAILPMTQRRSSLVWSEDSAEAARIMSLDDDGFSHELELRFGDYLGAVRTIGPRFSYPLSFLLAHSYYEGRTALIGDAAHVIHPIAGQGLNIGFKDVAAIVDVVCEARSLGLDIGGGEVLRRYQQWRRFDNASLAFLTDGLNRLFASDTMPQRLLRDVGLALVDKLVPARRFFVRQASGMAGEVPTLLRGELP